MGKTRLGPLGGGVRAQEASPVPREVGSNSNRSSWPVRTRSRKSHNPFGLQVGPETLRRLQFGASDLGQNHLAEYHHAAKRLSQSVIWISPVRNDGPAVVHEPYTYSLTDPNFDIWSQAGAGAEIELRVPGSTAHGVPTGLVPQARSQAEGC